MIILDHLLTGTDFTHSDLTEGFTSAGVPLTDDQAEDENAFFLSEASRLPFSDETLARIGALGSDLQVVDVMTHSADRLLVREQWDFRNIAEIGIHLAEEQQTSLFTSLGPP